MEAISLIEIFYTIGLVVLLFYSQVQKWFFGSSNESLDVAFGISLLVAFIMRTYLDTLCIVTACLLLLFVFLPYLFEVINLRTGIPCGFYEYGKNFSVYLPFGVPLKVVGIRTTILYCSLYCADWLRIVWSLDYNTISVFTASLISIFLIAIVEQIFAERGDKIWSTESKNKMRGWHKIPWQLFIGWYLILVISLYITRIAISVMADLYGGHYPFYGSYFEYIAKPLPLFWTGLFLLHAFFQARQTRRIDITIIVAILAILAFSPFFKYTLNNLNYVRHAYHETDINPIHFR